MYTSFISKFLENFQGGKGNRKNKERRKTSNSTETLHLHDLVNQMIGKQPDIISYDYPNVK